MKHYQLWRNQGAHQGWTVDSFDTTEEVLVAITAGGTVYGEEFVITEKLELAIVRGKQ